MSHPFQGSFVLIALLLIVACQQAPQAGPAEGTTPALPPDDYAHPAYKTVADMMRAKLAHAQAVLEGVATNDMDQVEQNAFALERLSQQAEWQVHRTMEYRLYSDDFQWTVRELARHAKERKVHATTLDFMQLTMNCVKCHDYMKEAGLVELDLAPLPKLVSQ